MLSGLRRPTIKSGIAKHRKLETALDEIEEMLQVIVKSNKVYPLQSNLYKILNIISKAKGEENAR